MEDAHVRKSLSYLAPFVEKISKLISPVEDPTKTSNVYSPGSDTARRLLSDELFTQLTLPGSAIRGFEHLEQLYQRCQAGESSLILMEHYGNFDLPAFSHLLIQNGAIGNKIADSLLAIQAIKLTASGGSAITSLFASCYATITIYPSREIDTIEDAEKRQKVRRISNPINHAAMRELTRRKYQGRIILLFPSGTRHRPWLHKKKSAVREIRSYLKVFQNVVFVGVNGNLLVPSKDENMEHDTLRKDVMLYTASPIYKCRDFLHQEEEEQQESQIKHEAKSVIAEKVMQHLEQLHLQTEPLHQELLKQLSALSPDEIPIDLF